MSKELQQKRACEYIREKLVSYDKKSIAGISAYKPAQRRLNERIEEKIREVYGRHFGTRTA
jgi:hypothetical protein